MSFKNDCNNTHAEAAMTIPNKGVIEVASFTDKYGDTRRIYQQGARGALKRERNEDTVSHKLSRAASAIIGANIKARRIAAGLSLEELCIKAGLRSETPKNRMWEIENAIRRTGTRMGTLYALAGALRCEVADLVPTVMDVMMQAGITSSVITTLAAK